ncbi:RING/U-box superfamily protein [Euphorbia peplus]|nr:RING/U-box superfamily protein [Euphorbia peplus]
MDFYGSLESLIQLGLTLLLLGVFLSALILFMYELFAWKQGRSFFSNDNNHNNNNVEEGMNVNARGMEVIVRVREGLDMEREERPRTIARNRMQAIILRNVLPPPVDYEDYKKMKYSSSTECAICLDEFEDRDLCRYLPLCKHVYHLSCISRWFLEEPSCPICRTSCITFT